jgi:ATP-binding cassette subfamily B protein
MEQPRVHTGPGAVFSAYWKYIRRHPWMLTFVLLGSTLLQVANLVAPLYLRKLFNLLATSSPSAAAAQALMLVLAVVASMWFLDWLSRRIMGVALVRLDATVMAELQADAFEYMLGHSNNFFISNFAGSLTHKVKQYSRAYESIFDGFILQFFPTFIFVGGAVIVLFERNHVLGTMLGVWSVAFIAFQVWVSRIRQPLRVERAEADTKVTATLADAIGNQLTISLFSAAAFEKKLFRSVVARWQEKTTYLWRADEFIWAGVGLFTILIQAALLLGAIHYWSLGMLTVGDFILVQAYLFTTFDRLIGINRELRMFYSALAEAGEMLEILNLPHEVTDARKAKKLKVSDAKVAFNDVQFYFHDGKVVLPNLSFTIAGGQKVALVGPSGAGKSTITKLLLRLFDVQDGTISIDDQDISKVTQDSLRQAISFVPQEPILFHRTLMENIRYGRRDASDEEVVAAAKKAHCHDFISGLSQGYDTYVGERGVKLSGGERQRVAIARAILKDSPILVLDEATSSLDSESEALIQDALQSLMQGKTVIVIAHRLSTIMKMDRILVVEAGTVVADGTHGELLTQGGLYQKLWSIQAGGFLVDEPEEVH